MMKKIMLFVAASAVSLFSVNAQASSLLTCQYNEAANKAYVIDLKECFKSLPIPFEDSSWFEFVDYQHPDTVTISGQYLLGQGSDKHDLNLAIYKRNSTLGVQGQVIIHYQH